MLIRRIFVGVPDNSSSKFPQCQQILGNGFCCVSSESCFFDSPSNCSAPNAVQCSKLLYTSRNGTTRLIFGLIAQLAKGTTQACCPPFTVCPSNFNQSTSLVRCNLIESSQSSATNPSTSSASPSSSPISSLPSLSLSSASTTISSSSGNALPLGSVTALSSTILSSPTSSSGAEPLSAGTDAGIGIGVAVAILSLVGLGFWLYRRGKNKGAAVATTTTSDVLEGRIKEVSNTGDMIVNGPPLGRYELGANSVRGYERHQGVDYNKYELPAEGLRGYDGGTRTH